MEIKTFELDQTAKTSLTVYLHESRPEFARVEKRPFVLVIPGGGYSFCSDREGEPIALNFAAAGYHTGVLRYHVGEHRDFKKALLDAEKSMKIIKELDDSWKVDREKIAVIGFSAGGHLATSLSNLSNEKPSLCILGYPAILKSFSNVMQIDAPSLDECVTSETPPTFLFSTFSDNVVPIENSLSYLKALEEQEVPFESHIFQEGLHGLSLATKWFGASEKMIDPRFARWFDLAVEWLENNWTKEAAENPETRDVLEHPLKKLCHSEKNQELILTLFPKFKDKSYFKIVRDLNLKQLAEIAPTVFTAERLDELKNKLQA